MNLYVKYGPIFYTITTRIKSFSDVIYYIGTFILPPIIGIIYLGLINHDIKFIFELSVLYIFIYCIFEIFYEIGYIFNDAFCKEERQKTERIKENLKESFWITQIILRIIIGIILLIVLSLNLNIGTENLIFLVIDIILMEVSFFAHNKIRNYSINIFTRIFLRSSKLALLVLIFKISGLNPENYKMTLLSIFIFYILDFFGTRMYQYNIKFGGTNHLKYGYYYFFSFIVFVLLFLTFKDIEFLLPTFLVLPKIIIFMLNEPHALSIKNNR